MLPLASRYVAAYIAYVGATLARKMVDPMRLEALRQPGDVNMVRASPFCALDSGFDGEIWLHHDALPSCPPPAAPATPTRSVHESARPKPSERGAIASALFIRST